MTSRATYVRSLILGALFCTSLTISIHPINLSFGYDDYNSEGQYRYISTGEISDNPIANDQLEICCSWSNAIADGILTYSIIEPDEADENATILAVENAVEEWDSNLEELELNKVKQLSSDPDIRISFNNVKSDENENREYSIRNNIDDQLTIIPTAGWTQFEFTGRGLVDKVNITISDDVLDFGFDNAIIEQITKHEMGHALGLGHSHNENRLMADIVIEDRTESISECEITGVLEANQWKLVNTGDVPSPPVKKYINC